jgi:hypothetical protein
MVNNFPYFTARSKQHEVYFYVHKCGPFKAMAVCGYIGVTLLAGGVGVEVEILVAGTHKSREPVKRGEFFFFTVARNVFLYSV